MAVSKIPLYFAGAISLAGLIIYRRLQVKENARNAYMKLGEYLEDQLYNNYEACQWYEQERVRLYVDPNYDAEKLVSGDVFADYTHMFDIKYISPMEDRITFDTLRVELQPILKQQNSNVLLKFETETVVTSGIGCSKPLQDLLDASNHQHAWEYIIRKERTWNPRLITNDFILELHAKIMSGSGEAKPGKYRSEEFVKIKGAKVLTAHPHEVPALMNRLLQWLYTTDEHPIDIIVNFHQRFVRIHPFVDGNGRACRLLCSFISLMAGYCPLIFDLTRTVYFDAIRKWEQQSDLVPFGKLIWNEVKVAMEVYKISVDSCPPGFPLSESQ